MSQSFLQIYGYVFSIGISYLASKLAKPRFNKDRAEDFAPTTLASQGSWIPRLWGRRRVGCVFAWAGDRESFLFTPGASPGKGSSRRRTENKQINYAEAAMHVLCVGPARRLTKVYADGKIIWEGDINSTDDPSGTTVQLGNGDEFVIYWGEADQPVDTFLADASRLGVASRWPHYCYVRWTRKGLGPQPRWPQMEYELEVGISDSPLLVGGYSFDGGDGAVTSAANDAADKYYTIAGGIHEAGITFPFWVVLQAKRPHISGTQGGVGVLWATRAASPGGQNFKIRATGTGWQVVANSFSASITEDWVEDAVTLIACFSDAGGGSYKVDIYSSETPAGATNTAASTFSELLIETYIGAYAFWGATVGSSWVEAFPYHPSGGASPEPGVIGPIKCFLGALPDADQRTRIFAGEDSETIAAETGATLAAHHAMTEEDGADDIAGTVGAMTAVGSPTFTILEGSTEITGPPAGVNPAHILAELLFAPYPLGLGLSTDEWDLSSLRDWADECESLSLPGSVYAPDGETAEAIVARLLQDHGCLIRWNGRDLGGKFELVRLREPCLEGALNDGLPLSYPISESLFEILPEIEVNHAEQPADTLLYQFPDEAREYRPTSIGIGQDGQARYLEHARAEKVDLGTVVDFAAAAVIAERRSQEELGPPVRQTFELRGGGRMLLPGDRLDVEGFPYLFRCMEVRPRSLGGGAQVTALQDAYGVAASGFEAGDSGSGTPIPGGTPLADLAFTFVEVPAHLLGPAGTPPAIVVPRIRADVDQTFADLWISEDDVTYRLVEREGAVVSGGSLLENMDATGWILEDGPTFTALGPDIGEVEDLSANEPEWRRCRQLALIGEELFACREVELVSGSTYRLKGLIRARYDTTRASHSIGDKVYIFRPDEVAFVQDPMLTPGRSLYVKTQPYSGGTALSLASVTEVNRTLAGKGIVPMRPCALEVVSPYLGVPSYSTGEDVVFRWAHRSTQIPGTGAGMHPAGAAVGSSDPQGTFEVRVYDSGDTLVATYDSSDGVTESGWTYDNADLQTDLGGETDFRIEVRNVNGGWRSDPIELEVEFLA